MKNWTRKEFLQTTAAGGALLAGSRVYGQTAPAKGSANGDIRVIAVLTDERVPGFDDIPTATEQGYPVVAVNWRGLYVPKGVSDDTFNSWADKLQMVADSAEWKEAMAANGLAPFTKVGGNFQGYVDGLVADINAMSKELGVIQ